MRTWFAICVPALLGACLPLEYPFVDEDPDVGTPPPAHESCSAYESVESDGHWMQCFVGEGRATVSVPGMIASVPIVIQVDVPAPAALFSMKLMLTVQTGQALPGKSLSLREATTDPMALIGPRLLQEATLEGPYDNRATFELEVSLAECGPRCSFNYRLSAEPVELSVPVPVALAYELSVSFDGDTTSLARVQVLVGDAIR